MDLILKPFSWILLQLINATNNFALALVIFTLIVKVVLFPLNLKGKRSMMQMNALSAKQQQLQKQYGKDQQRYQQELTKLYQEEGVSPMGGCLWSFLPLPILIGLYSIIRRPLFYLMGLTTDQVSSVVQALADAGASVAASSSYAEIQAAEALNNPEFMAVAQNALGDAADKLMNINFNLFGINLGSIPNFRIWSYDVYNWNTIGLFLIPLVVAVVCFLSSKISMKTNVINQNKNSDSGNASVDATNRSMMIMMPIMYVWFGYIMPGGMSIYMISNAVFTMLQDIICAKLLRSKFAEAQAKRDEEKRKAKAAEKLKKQEAFAQKQRELEEAKKARKKNSVDHGKKQNQNQNGRIGIRTYALGRDYDPDRYGGVTPYHDPDSKDGSAVPSLPREEDARPSAAPVVEEKTSVNVTETAPETVETVEKEAAQTVNEEENQ